MDIKKMLENKRIGLLLLGFIIGIIGIGIINAATLGDQIITARKSGTKITSYSGVNVGKTVPADYSFGFGNKGKSFESGGKVAVTKAVSDSWGTISNYDATNISLAKNDSSIKGKFYALYKNVGIYNGKIIDVKATVMDYEWAVSPTSTPTIQLTSSYIGNSVRGLKWVRIKYDFFESGTTTPITIKGNTTYWDVDGNQGIILDNNSKGLYSTSNSSLKVTKVSSSNYVYSDYAGNQTTSRNTVYAFTETFAGSSLTRTYTYGTPDSSWTANGAGGMSHSSMTAVPALPSKPTKAVSKENVSIGEAFTYTITEVVPGEIPANYFKAFKIEDTLKSGLSVSSSNVSIKNEYGTNVTSDFNVAVSGQKITITPNSLTDEGFYGHTYVISIKTSIKKNADLSSYKSGNYYVIPNNATLTYTDSKSSSSTSTSNTVNVKTKIPVTVKYHLVGDSVPNSSSMPADESKYAGDSYSAQGILTTTYTDKKCTFNGWYSNSALTGNKYTSGTLSGNLDLYGKWDCKDPVTVKYHVIPNSDNIPPADSYSLPLDESKWDGDSYTAKGGITTSYKDKKCTFNGWYSNNSLTGEKYTTGTLSGNLDLYGNFNCEDLINKPTKTASKESINIGEQYTYTITHEVPEITDSTYYYSDYEVRDNIASVLEVKKVKVLDKDSNDVTDKFDISEGSAISIRPKDLTASSFYNQIYKYQITVSLKEGSDLSSYKQNDKCIIPNKAQAIVNENTLETDTVNVEVEKVNVRYHVSQYEGNIPPENTYSIPSNESKLAGDSYTAKGALTTTYTEKKCAFDGWYSNSSFTGNKYTRGTLNNDLDLYGKWVCNNAVSVNYHLLGNDVPLDSVSAIPQSEIKYIGDSYTAKGGLTTTYKNKKCTFNGWYSNSELTGDKYTTGTLNNDLDLYGKFNCENLIKNPSKVVSKEIVKGDEEFVYTITHDVPSITDSNYYYSKYEIKDSIDPALTVKGVKVLDKNNNDVTDKFNVNSGNYINISAKNLNDSAFYNQTYKYLITVNVKQDYNLNTYKQGNEYIIPNKGQAVVNDQTLDTNIVPVKYIPKYTLVVHHYKENTEEEVVENSSTSETKYEGDNYTVNALTNIPEGYELISDESVSGTITGDTVVIFYYKEKEYTLTVHHYKEKSEESLAPDENTTKKYNESYETNVANVPSNYELVSTPSNATGIITGDTTVTYYYKLKEGVLKTKYLEDGTNKVLAPEQTKNVHFGDEYETESSSSIPQNYILKKTPDDYKGVISKPTTEVIYYYVKKDSNIVPTISKTGTEEITSSNSKVSYSINYKVDFTDYIDNVVITLTDKLPYKIDQAKSNLDGGTYNDSNQTITWTKEVDVNSYNKASEIITKNIEVVYKNINFKEKTIVNTIEGNIKGDGKNITVVDKHNTGVKIYGNIIVRYIDKETNKELLDPIKTSNLVGGEYILPEDASIEGYKLVSKPDIEKCEYKEGTQEIKYYYERIKVQVLTKVRGAGGTIEGNEVVYYGNDSTKDKIRIKASNNYYIDKVWINGKEIEVPKESTVLVISNFPKMTDNKLVEVSFKAKPTTTVVVPKTSSFIPALVMAFAALLVGISSFIMYRVFRKRTFQN